MKSPANQNSSGLNPTNQKRKITVGLVAKTLYEFEIEASTDEEVKAIIAEKMASQKQGISENDKCHFIEWGQSSHDNYGRPMHVKSSFILDHALSEGKTSTVKIHYKEFFSEENHERKVAKTKNILKAFKAINWQFITEHRREKKTAKLSVV